MAKTFLVCLIVFCSIAVVVGVVGFLYFNEDIPKQSPPPLEKYTLTFVNVGYEYKVVVGKGVIPVIRLMGGQLNLTKGSEVKISVSGDINYKAEGYLVNENITTGDTLGFFEVNKNLIIEAVITETNYKKAMDTFKLHSITVIKIDDIERVRGLSHGLTKIRVSSLNEYILFIESRNESAVFYYRGRLFSDGWIWDSWDYFLFVVEPDVIYYYRQDK